MQLLLLTKSGDYKLGIIGDYNVIYHLITLGCKIGDTVINIKPILVTGAHRSGTTWIGRMIAESPLIGYIDEPFNPLQSRGICAAKFDYWFTYISRENESAYYEHINNTLRFSYNLSLRLKTITPSVHVRLVLRELQRVLREYDTFRRYRNSNMRPLVKDPIAIFSAEWLAQTFDMDVIILIRHPAAFAGSLKKLNWKYSFSNFLGQHQLMKDHLYPFEADIRAYIEKEHDIIDQAALLWRIIYYMVVQYKKNHDDWAFVRHEDISREPLRGFQTLFDKLNIELSEHVRTTIVEYTANSNPDSAAHWNSLKLDSESNIWNWKKRLTESEVERIRTQVEDISNVFYRDEDW